MSSPNIPRYLLVKFHWILWHCIYSWKLRQPPISKTLCDVGMELSLNTQDSWQTYIVIFFTHLNDESYSIDPGVATGVLCELYVEQLLRSRVSQVIFHRRRYFFLRVNGYNFATKLLSMEVVDHAGLSIIFYFSLKTSIFHLKGCEKFSKTLESHMTNPSLCASHIAEEIP